MGRQRRRSRPPRLTTRKVVEPPELAEALATLVRAFKVKYGRLPGPDDPIFFDPDADTPTPISPDLAHDDPAGAPRAASLDLAGISAVAHAATPDGHAVGPGGTGSPRGDASPRRGDADADAEPDDPHDDDPHDDPHDDPRHAERQREGGGEALAALDNLPTARASLRPVLIASTQTMLAEPRMLRRVGPLIQPARDVALPDEQARLNELVAAQLVEWLLLARDRYPAPQRHRAAERGLVFASQLPAPDQAAARDLLGLLGVGPPLSVRRLAHHTDGAAILGLWALVCGLVDSLGDGDTELLRQLIPDPPEQG